MVVVAAASVVMRGEVNLRGTTISPSADSSRNLQGVMSDYCLSGSHSCGCWCQDDNDSHRVANHFQNCNTCYHHPGEHHAHCGGQRQSLTSCWHTVENGIEEAWNKTEQATKLAVGVGEGMEQDGARGGKALRWGHQQ